jgi:hypothetical protein
MTQGDRQDPLHELRRADPAHMSPAPSESKARIWARIQEATMDDTRSASRRRIAWAGGLAAAAVAGIAALALLLNPGTPSPGPTDDPDTGIGSCVETYSLDALANRDFAFDGTVAAIDGDSVTFSVNEAFSGDASSGESITLSAPGMSGTSITSAGGPILTEGERYLVAGDDEFVWACGFTQPYDEALAAEWAEAAR